MSVFTAVQLVARLCRFPFATRRRTPLHTQVSFAESASTPSIDVGGPPSPFKAADRHREQMLKLVLFSKSNPNGANKIVC